MRIGINGKRYIILLRGLTILLLHFTFLLQGQEIRKNSTTEILHLKEQVGIDSVLKYIGLEIPIYRIDSALALNFAYDYDQIKDLKIQTNFLSEVSLFIRNDSLNAKLLNRLTAFRTDNLSLIPLIEDDLFY